MRIALLLLIPFLFTACNQPKYKEPVPSELFQHWKHSYEEQVSQGNEAVYRPANFMSFPASRFRMSYIFKPNGTCQYLQQSPIDAHSMKPCRFTYDNRIIKIYALDADETLIKTLQVLTALKNRLVLLEK